MMIASAVLALCVSAGCKRDDKKAPEKDTFTPAAPEQPKVTKPPVTPNKKVKRKPQPLDCGSYVATVKRACRVGVKGGHQTSCAENLARLGELNAKVNGLLFAQDDQGKRARLKLKSECRGPLEELYTELDDLAMDQRESIPWGTQCIEFLKRADRVCMTGLGRVNTGSLCVNIYQDMVGTEEDAQAREGYCEQRGADLVELEKAMGIDPPEASGGE